MKNRAPQDMTIRDLVDRFVEIALDQDRAILEENIRHFNRLYGLMDAVKDELKHRDNDQRIVLLELYNHPNPQVRLKAAHATLAVAPEQARNMLRTIADSREYPQDAYARSAIRALKDGIYKPG